VAAIFHHGTDIITGDFHKMSDKGVSKAVACPSVRLSIIKLGQTSSFEAGPRYRIVECRHCCASEYEGAAIEGCVSAERFRRSGQPRHISHGSKGKVPKRVTSLHQLLLVRKGVFFALVWSDQSTNDGVPLTALIGDVGLAQLVLTRATSSGCSCCGV